MTKALLPALAAVFVGALWYAWATSQALVGQPLSEPSILFFSIHILSLMCAGTGIVWADILAASWMRGTIETVKPVVLIRLHRLVALALAGIIGSGLLMFWPLRGYFMAEPAFWLKMSFIFVLLANSFVIEALMDRATTHPFRSLTVLQKLPLYISGAVSVACWAGAGLLAFFILP